MKMTGARWFTAMLVGATCPFVALAQDDGTGIRAGVFVITPSVEARTGYSDNYLRSNTIQEDSFYYSIDPSVSVQSDWSRHALSLQFGAGATFYDNSSQDDEYRGNVDAEFLLDVTRATDFNFQAGYARQVESRGDDFALIGADAATGIDNLSGAITASYKPGVMRVSPFVSYQRAIYDDTELVGGGEANNDDRDRSSVGYGVELGFEYIRGYEFFLRGAGLRTFYDQSRDFEGFERGSTDAEVSAGVNFKVTNLIEGRAGAGYAYRMFDDARFADVGTVTFDIGLDWSPTPLSAVSLTGFQEFEESTTPGVSSANTLGANLEASYEVFRYFSLSPSVGYTRKEFDGSARQDDLYEAGLGAAYALSPSLQIGADYNYGYEESSTAGDVEENRFSIGLKAKY